jgi:hypothetical protein
MVIGGLNSAMGTVLDELLALKGSEPTIPLL